MSEDYGVNLSGALAGLGFLVRTFFSMTPSTRFIQCLHSSNPSEPPKAMSSTDYVVIEGLPTPEAYHDLRDIAGLTPPPAEAVPTSLKNSWVGFVAYEAARMLDSKTPAPNQPIVGMGRLIGDGALFLILVDIAVHPSHQGRGIGKRITQALVDYVDAHAPLAYVSLVAEGSAQKLYLQYGFKNVEPSVGMFRMKGRRRIHDIPIEEGGEKVS